MRGHRPNRQTAADSHSRLRATMGGFPYTPEPYAFETFTSPSRWTGWWPTYSAGVLVDSPLTLGRSPRWKSPPSQQGCHGGGCGLPDPGGRDEAAEHVRPAVGGERGVQRGDEIAAAA